MISQEVIAFGAMALLGAQSFIASVFVLDKISALKWELSRIHQQNVNIVTMLLRAGFRPAHAGRDWSMDSDSTRALGQIDYTQYDWKRPDS